MDADLAYGKEGTRGGRWLGLVVNYRYVPGKSSERWFPPAAGEFLRNVDSWATQSRHLWSKDLKGWCLSDQLYPNDDFSIKDSKRS